MITRNYSDLEREFDLIIVGGGIYGTAMAWEAVSRGLSVVLLEKKDFIAATSANSLKIIHGGLRYLQTLDIKRVLESVRERKTVLKIAPHLVQPLPCIMPTYGVAMKSKHVMWAGMLVNDILSFNRNFGMDKELKLSNCHVLSRSASQQELPALTDDNYTGAACWYDGQAYNTERLALSYLLSAVDRGALAYNYTQVNEFIHSGNRVAGVKAIDLMTDTEFEVKGKMVITAGGPWTNSLTGLLNGGAKQSEFILSKAINLVLKRKISKDKALGITSKIEYQNGVKRERSKRRQLFITPWRDYTVIGTTHLPWSGKPDDYRVSASDINDFLLELNDLLPGADLKRSDVSFFHGGVLPLAEQPVPGQDVKLLGHYRILDQEQENGIGGLMNVVGVKYTTARDVAEKALDAVTARLNKKQKVFSTRNTPVLGGNITDVKSFMSTTIDGVADSVTTSLLRNYGDQYKNVIALSQEEPALLQPLAPDSHVIGAQVVHAVRNEGALKLSDVVLRRTDLGSAEQPPDAALRACADLMARELNWDARRIEQEISETCGLYIPAEG